MLALPSLPYIPDTSDIAELAWGHQEGALVCPLPPVLSSILSSHAAAVKLQRLARSRRAKAITAETEKQINGMRQLLAVRRLINWFRRWRIDKHLGLPPTPRGA